MALRKIATIGNPVLRNPSRALTREELATEKMQTFIDDLIETMFDASGAGIAAPQVYEPIRVCVLHVKDNPRYPYKPNIPLTVLVNPTIELLSSETFLNNEGCLSVPNLRGEVPRSVKIRVKAWDRNGAELDFEAVGLTAGTYQHEVDHLDGKLFVDRVVDTRSLCTWHDFERYKMAEFVERAKALVARLGG